MVHGLSRVDGVDFMKEEITYVDLSQVCATFINLDSRPDKAEQIVRSTLAAGFREPKRHAAVHHRKGARGLSMSHFNVLCTAQDLPLLVLEDDAEAVSAATTLAVPADADVIYLGTSNWSYRWWWPNMNPQFSATSVPGVLKLRNMLSAHAILYLTNRARDAFAKSAYNSYRALNPHVDVGFAKLQRRLNVYCIDNPIFIQREWEGSMSAAHLWTRSALTEYPKFNKYGWIQFPAK